MEHHNIQGVPEFESSVFSEKSSDYAVLIPVINEGNRILTELKRMKRISAAAYADIIICDGGSADGSMEHRRLQALQVNTLLTKTGPGRQGAQLRMGIWFALQRRYKGIITVDGNNKDSVENIPDFIRKLDEGYDLVQGSRYVPGGKAVNTPLIRAAALHRKMSAASRMCIWNMNQRYGREGTVQLASYPAKAAALTVTKAESERIFLDKALP